jgi:DNA-binding beta-propeller fold protein YncE
MLFTMAGEKMPWLTTHLTIPLILATGWYLGTVLDKVDWQAFWNRGWALIVLSPILVIALANVIGPFLFGNPPLSGLSRDDLLKTFTWMGALLLAGLIVAAVVYIWRRIGPMQTVRIAGLGVFALLGVLTFRTAWMAAYINYDYATEFLVYAHGAPANKTAMSVIEDISRRTTDGLNIHVAYDNLVSWPGSWYFRNYSPGSFKGDMSGFTDADSYLAILVGNDNNSKIENQLTDKFYKVKYIRLWWPMQDYFNLNPERIDHLFEPYEYTGNDGTVHNVAAGDLARGVWDIWWNRDYTAYGKATGGDFDVSRWPVADWMYFYVRKDVAAQIWNFGTGATKVAGLPEDAFKSLRCDTCAANLVFASAGDQPGQLNHPRGMAIGPDGNLYVADSQNARIAIFDPDGKLLRQFGTVSTTDPNSPVTPLPGSLREPWGVAVGQDGTIYVADTWNHRIQVFDNNGTFLRMWGEFEQLPPAQEGKPNGFWGPRDVAVDSQNNVYVADTGNKRIRVYDARGNLLRTIGQGGATVGQLNEPVGLAINPQTGELFVADTWNRRIDVFDLSGTYRRSWNVLAWGTTTETGSRPYLALDRTGTRLFVTDPDAGRVLVFDTNGTAMLTFGTLGTDASSFSASQFGTLGGIVIDKADRLFLADAQSSRLLRFSVESLPGLMPPPAIGNGGRPNNPPEQIGTPAATSEEPGD